jgi:poly(A) polymerase
MSADRHREFAADVVRRLQAAGFQALWAGGCVRDFLLGREPKDYDVATDARPEQVRELFGRRKTLAIGASFGVIVVVAPRGVENVEVATFRADAGYSDGRRPDRVEFTTAEEDAKRRDFTINGMFYDPIAGRPLDFVGGEHDLAAGVVRAIGDPRERMTEDKLRMLRAVRFTATLDFRLDEATAAAIRSMAHQLTVVSAERIAQELRKMLTDRHRRRAIELCRDVDLLTVIFPEFELIAGPDPADAWHRTLDALRLLDDAKFPLALATLWHALPVPIERGELASRIARRLKLSNDERDQAKWLLEHLHALDEADALPAHQLKRLLAAPHIEELLQLVRVRLLAEGADLHPVLWAKEYLESHAPEEIDPPPLVTGDDLIAHGLKPGKRFKDLLESIRNAQLDGEIHSKEEALALVERLQQSGE